jgi:two-component system NarL family response regulator
MYTARQPAQTSFAPPSSPPPVPSRKIRVLLVDDHGIMREGLAALLERDGRATVVGQAGNGEEALRLFQDLTPDVSVVDLRMVPMDGAELTAKMRELDPGARVVMLTTYDTDEEVYRGLRSGAASYLLKDVHFDKLVDTICEVFAGRKSISPEIAAKLAEHVAQDALTARQLEVLKCLSKGMSNHEIGSTLFISEGTVKAHVKAILRKLDARDRTQAISIAMKRGLVRSE